MVANRIPELPRVEQLTVADTIKTMSVVVQMRGEPLYMHNVYVTHSAVGVDLDFGRYEGSNQMYLGDINYLNPSTLCPHQSKEAPCNKTIASLTISGQVSGKVSPSV